MAWWRRDPSLWARTPIHRYARRTLRDHEATLRFRCFSKSNPAFAQHKEDDDDDGRHNHSSKPAGMSNLQWMQLQHYRRWKRKLEEDPYRALFGASEDMLGGKGLRGWEWIHRTFPEWMVGDVGVREGEKEGESKRGKGKGRDGMSKSQDEEAKSTGKSYPKKVEVEAEEMDKKERASIFREPERPYRVERFERDLWNSGVESPSDSRRPREYPLPEMSSKSVPTPATAKPQKSIPTENVDRMSRAPEPDESTTSDTKAARREAAAREASFIEEFLADTPQSGLAASNEKERSVDWRQTVLDRRVTPDFVPTPRRRTDMPIIDVTSRAAAARSKENATSAVEESKESSAEKSGPTPTPTLQAGEDSVGANNAVEESAKAWLLNRGPSDSSTEILAEKWSQSKSWGDLLHQSRNLGSELDSSPKRDLDGKVGSSTDNNTNPMGRVDEWLIEPRKDHDAIVQHEKSDTVPSPRKSTSDILNQLPKDDMDFLSADEIRASMGRKKGDQEDKNVSRQELEKNFKDAQKERWQLDSMVESKIVNDQHVRRMERELLQNQEQGKVVEQETSSTTPSMTGEPRATQDSSTQVSVLETGLDFMSRWLHTGGNVLAQHFWQDPVQVIEGQHLSEDAHDPFLKGIVKGVNKGRRAMEHVKEELAKDVPASQPLIDRLTKDERKASAGASVILTDKFRKKKEPRSEDEAEAEARQRVEKLRQALLDTDKESKQACEAVDKTESSTKPSESFARRFRLAADVLHKNAKLTRMMIFGIQARFEVAGDTRPDEKVRELTHRLLALQDTQLALARLVVRAIQVFGVELKPEEEVLAKPKSYIVVSHGSPGDRLNNAEIPPSSTNTASDAIRLRNDATDSLLEHEISAQKAAMKGLSDDGYSRAPKPIVRKSLDKPNPLAHSLFRPFSLQLESLGKEVDAEKLAAEEAANSKKADKQLVKEVKKAYEDMYGPITVDHRQVKSDEGSEEVVEITLEVAEALSTAQAEEIPLQESKPATRQRKQASIQLLKEDAVSPSVSALKVAPVADQAETTASTIPTDDWISKPNLVSNKSVRVDSEASSAVSEEPPPSTNTVNESAATEEPQPSKTSSSQTPETDNSPYIIEDFDPEYQILTYDPQADELLITSSPAPTASQNPFFSSPIPFHDALATLSHPAKFLPHLPSNFEIIAAKPTMLILRSSPAATSSSSMFSTIRVPASPDAEPLRDEGAKTGINPIDGTTRLSPTGYEGVGVELEREFDERRRAAGELNGNGRSRRDREKEERRDRGRSKDRSERRRETSRGRVGVGGVVKTAIVAGA